MSWCWLGRSQVPLYVELGFPVRVLHPVQHNGYIYLISDLLEANIAYRFIFACGLFSTWKDDKTANESHYKIDH